MTLPAIFRCGIVDDFTQPEIISAYPANHMTGVDSDTTVTIVFSKKMDTTKTSNEFALSCSFGAIEGFFYWDMDGRKLVFQPKKSLITAEQYTIFISSAAEDAAGNDLKKPFTSIFSVSIDLSPPTVISHTPANDAMVVPDSAITVRFSEPIDLNTLYSGITISPPLQGSYTWDLSHAHITFTPLYKMSYGTTYSVIINTDIKDTSGNALAERCFYNFTVGDDFVKPTLNVTQPPSSELWREDIENTGVEKNNDLVIEFSEEIQISELRNAITITPACEFFVDTNPVHTAANITFKQPLKSEEHYTLKISPTITDMQNNPLEKEYSFHFFTNGAGSIAPVITAITDPKNPGGWALNDIQPLTFDPPSPPDLPGYYSVQIHFSSKIMPTSLALSIERTLGTGATPQITNPDWPEIAPGNKFNTYSFDIYGVKAGATYKITIKGGENGARDLRSNYLKNDFVQYIRF